MRINFLKYKKFYFIFSGTLVLGSLICLAIFGLQIGIDFAGGSILEVKYLEARPERNLIETTLADLDLGEILIQPIDEKGIIVRMKEINVDTYEMVLERLRGLGGLIEKRFELIGPVVGRELRNQAIIIAILSLIAILFYVALAFHKVSRPVSSWQYSFAALIALFHDVIITLGIFSLLGIFFQIQITIPIVIALLVILGYSINDTVVVFDRIRENLLESFQQKHDKSSYEEIVNKSLGQTLTRSINTSLTTLLVLAAIFFFGGITLRYFALALILGISIGTYSSMFLASPLLVSWLHLRKNLKRKPA